MYGMNWPRASTEINVSTYFRKSSIRRREIFYFVLRKWKCCIFKTDDGLKNSFRLLWFILLVTSRRFYREQYQKKKIESGRKMLTEN